MATQLPRASVEPMSPGPGLSAGLPWLGDVWPRLRPPARRGAVVRSGLLTRLTESREARVVLLTGAAGWGKTMLLAQWAATDGRPFAWVALDTVDNDPAALIADLTRAVRQTARSGAGQGWPGRGRGEAGSQVPHPSPIAPLKWRARTGQPWSFVLVLDDAHVLHAPGCLAALAAIVESLPSGSQLAIAGRRDPRLPLARWSARGDLRRLGTEDLAMTRAEASALLRASAVELDGPELGLLLDLTEGWPALLSLAARELGQRPGETPAAKLAAPGRLVAEYLREEVLGPLPDELKRFATEASVLRRLSGPLCDAALARTGSGGVLRELERWSVGLVPLDGCGEWYRQHRLLAEVLQADLRLQPPAAERETRRRASAWYEAHGDPAEAIAHARAAGDLGRAADLVWANLFPHLARGRLDEVQRWLDGFTEAEAAASPALALATAWCHLASGDGMGARRWAATASRGPHAGPLPGGPSSVAGAVAILRAAIAADGLARMREDAALGQEPGRDASSWEAARRLLEGVAWRLAGEPERARSSLTGVEELASAPSAPWVLVQSLAHLALLAVETDDWEHGATLVARAKQLLDRHRVGGPMTLIPVHVASALVLAHEGRAREARRDARRSILLLAKPGYLPPWLAIDARVVLARANLLVGDASTACALVREARRALARTSDAGVLGPRLEEVWQAAEGYRRAGIVAPAALSTAELRILRFLPTHLSYREIGQVLHVSQCTVKSQVLSAYRKLDVASRSQAVDRARALGLIVPEDVAPLG